MDEEEETSMVLNRKLHVGTAETSDSGYTNLIVLRASKRCRHENSASYSLGRFKGVVPQQNGRWGAQIYANNHRIWLGTFKSDQEAAMAYDRAAMKLRSKDSHRNFHIRNIQEPNFQDLYTTENVLTMIRDGSYEAKFADFVKFVSKKGGHVSTLSPYKIWVHGDVHFSSTQLFEKELTPSDVGKLNRLVIPKKYAIKYFPYINCDNYEQSLHGGGDPGPGVQDIELVFFDKFMRTWKFRYCYWKSSQSFVFTRGWNRFVKDKKLRERDIIIFYTCEYPTADGDKNAQNFFLIDVNYNEESNRINEEEEKKVFNRLDLESSSQQDDDLQVELELELNLGKNYNTGFNFEDKALSGLKSSQNVEAKRFTLFGVHIN